MGLLENILGSVKDTASLSKATLLSTTATTTNSLSLRLFVLRATSHDASSPPSPRHLSSLLSLANSSPRASASSAVDSLMSRLHSTRSSSVALKCLLLLHSFIRRGSFILHDQISVRRRLSHLILSSFRDSSSASSWSLSSFIRWYARYLEQILSTSSLLGFFLFSLSCRLERQKAIDNLPSLFNFDLLREIQSLIDVLEETARSPEISDTENVLVIQVMSLVAEDYSTAVEDLASRIGEFAQRMSCVSFADSVEMFCALKRLDDCRERLLEARAVAGVCSEAALWRITGRVREELVAVSDKVEKMAVLSWRRVGETGGSERFGKRVSDVGGGESLRFSSNRFTFQR